MAPIWRSAPFGAGIERGTARQAAERAQVAHQRAQIAGRAELQHRWYIAGDPRGTYGRYPPVASCR